MMPHGRDGLWGFFRAGAYFCAATYARRASFTRVCQPGPVALSAASTSASKRMVVETLRAAKGGRPKRSRGLTASHSSSVSGRASGSDCAAAVMAASLVLMKG
jgi:hypothetical protein